MRRLCAAVLIAALACGRGSGTASPPGHEERPDSIDAIEAAMRALGGPNPALKVVTFYPDRDGYLIRLADTTPRVRDGVVLLWVPRSAEKPTILHHY